MDTGRRGTGRRGTWGTRYLAGAGLGAWASPKVAAGGSAASSATRPSRAGFRWKEQVWKPALRRRDRWRRGAATAARVRWWRGAAGAAGCGGGGGALYYDEGVGSAPAAAVLCHGKGSAAAAGRFPPYRQKRRKLPACFTQIFARIPESHRARVVAQCSQCTQCLGVHRSAAVVARASKPAPQPRSKALRASATLPSAGATFAAAEGSLGAR
jgi:hypothetical protein